MPPIHEVVGRNVTRYSGVTDLDLVTNLGPDQLDSTTRTVPLDPVDSFNSSDNSFTAVTSTLSGNITFQRNISILYQHFSP